MAALRCAVCPKILRAGLPAVLILAARLPLVLILILPLRVAGAPPRVERRATGAALTARGALTIVVAAPIAVVAAARLRIRGHAHHQHRRKQHGRFHHGHRPPLVFAPINARGRLRVRSAGGAILHALGLYPPPLWGGSPAEAQRRRAGWGSLLLREGWPPTPTPQPHPSPAGCGPCRLRANLSAQNPARRGLVGDGRRPEDQAPR